MQAKQKSDRIGDGHIRIEEGMEPGYAMKRISKIEYIRILMGQPLGTVAEYEVCEITAAQGGLKDRNT
jgi:hypothetical protein